MKLQFRMHSKADEDALVEFWNQNSGWGEIDKAIWRSKFMESPLGDSSFALAVDQVSGQLVAQFGFVPSLVSCLGEEIRAYRPVAIMLRKDVRQKNALIGVPKLIMQLYTFAADQLRAQGIGLVHMVPDHRWARLFSVVPAFRVISFPLYTLPLPLPGAMTLDPGFEVRPMSYDDPVIDALWEQVKNSYSCLVVRNRPALRWKNSHRPFKLWGLYRQEQLVGLFSAYLKDKNRKWQICDMLAADLDAGLSNLLRAACIEGQRAWEALPVEDRPLREAEIFPSAAMEPAVQALGFEKVKYKFSMVLHLLDKHLPDALTRAENWYVSPNE